MSTAICLDGALALGQTRSSRPSVGQPLIVDPLQQPDAVVDVLEHVREHDVGVALRQRRVLEAGVDEPNPVAVAGAVLLQRLAGGLHAVSRR
jgi:hypothetical protein